MLPIIHHIGGSAAARAHSAVEGANLVRVSETWGLPRRSVSLAQHTGQRDDVGRRSAAAAQPLPDEVCAPRVPRWPGATSPERFARPRARPLARRPSPCRPTFCVGQFVQRAAEAAVLADRRRRSAAGPAIGLAPGDGGGVRHAPSEHSAVGNRPQLYADARRAGTPDVTPPPEPGRAPGRLAPTRTRAHLPACLTSLPQW